MGRLRTLPPRIETLSPRLVRPETRDARRVAEAPWRRWYSTARWQQLRLRIAEREGWRCRQTGVRLVDGRTRPDALVVDHVRPHRGDEALFWDETNLQAVSKAWHDAEKQRRERREGVV